MYKGLYRDWEIRSGRGRSGSEVGFGILGEGGGNVQSLGMIVTLKLSWVIVKRIDR